MRRLGAVLMAVTAALAVAPVAATATALTATTAAAATAPAGYRNVNSAPIAVPPGGANVAGQATCPAGTVPWGGGVGFTAGTPNPGESISTSAPTATGWTGRYNNSGTHTGDHFVVSALCAARPAGYTVVTAQVDNPPGAVSTATAMCPANTQTLGGGASSTATTSHVQLLSAWPLFEPGGYRAVMSNGSAADQQLTAYAICGIPDPGFAVVTQTSTNHVAPVVLIGGAVCPAGSAIVGGGIQVQTPRPTATLGSSIDDSGPQWFSEVAIGDQGTATVTITAICDA